jgi:hypothetical protein
MPANQSSRYARVQEVHMFGKILIATVKAHYVIDLAVH